MEDRFVCEMQQRLLMERGALQVELERLRSLALAEEARSEHAGLGNHMADDATEMFEQERDLALQQHTARLLARVESALRRIVDGTYGLCAKCGQPIDRARLETLPYADLCVPCKMRQEKP